MGWALVVLPFALSLFDRAPAGERVTNRFRSTLSANGLHDLPGNFGTMGGMVDQLTHQASRPSIKPGAVELVRRQVASAGDASELNGLDFTPLPWDIMGPGIALLLTGGIALKRQESPGAEVDSRARTVEYARAALTSTVPE